MKKFKIIYVQCDELKSFEVQTTDIEKAIEMFRELTFVKASQIISVNQLI